MKTLAILTITALVVGFGKTRILNEEEKKQAMRRADKILLSELQQEDPLIPNVNDRHVTPPPGQDYFYVDKNRQNEEQQKFQDEIDRQNEENEQRMHDIMSHGRFDRDVRHRQEMKNGRLRRLPQHRFLKDIESKTYYHDNQDEDHNEHPTYDSMKHVQDHNSGPWKGHERHRTESQHRVPDMTHMRGRPSQSRGRSSQSKNIVIKMSSAGPTGAELCPLCEDFTRQAINELLNIILNAGVVGSCSELCKLLEEKTGSTALELVCNLVCDYAGIKEFIKFIEKADLDPIYFCELIKMCPIVDNGDATITMLTVDPKIGPQGEKLITLVYVSNNGTGTGDLVFAVKTVDGIPVESGSLLQAAPPGKYSGNIHLKAVPDPSCDPTQELCEMWLPGNYTVAIALCNGECGSSHPHSKIYDEKKANFTITG